MIDWVNCLKLKLRELKILSPKENIYTKPPGMMRPTVLHRNPTDPLPQRPMNVTDIPGLELVNHNNDNTIQRNDEDNANESEEVSNILNNLNISNFINDINEDESSTAIPIPISIPVFNNFSNSNTTSQNLINLLSNPLRHTSNNNNNFMPFSMNVLQNADDEDDDFDDDEIEDEIEDEDNIIVQQSIAPTSLEVDYVPEDVQLESMNRDNITVIEIAENQQLSQIKERLKNDPKVTKIKIELDSTTTTANNNESVVSVVNNCGSVNGQKVVEKNDDIPSTSTSNGIEKIEKEKSGIEKIEVIESVVKSAEKLEVKEPKRPSNVVVGTPKKTPIHEKRKLSLREKQVQQLIQEINSEIRFKLRKKDCIDSMAFVTAFNGIWIAGLKPIPSLYCLHVGDQLLAINNIVVKSPSDAQKYIKMCSGLFVEITIRRLPLAGIYFIRREFEGQCLGIIRDKGSAAIVEVIPNSISSHIPPRPAFDENSTWIITQINFRNLSLISHKKYDETELLLNSSGLEISLLLQPSEFIVKLKKELKANFKNYRDYLLQ
jgi:hypothetical protein